MELLRYDSDVMGAISRIADYMILNIICVLCSLPIVTAGASMAAKYYVAMKIEKGTASGVVKPFFHSFRQNLGQGASITCILLLAGAFFGFDWYLIYSSEGGSISPIIIGMLAIFTVLYLITAFCVFPLISRFEMRTIEAVKNALIFGVANLPRAILGVVLTILPIIIGIWYFKWAWLIWLGTESVAVYYNSRFFIRKFRELEIKAFGKSVDDIDYPEYEKDTVGGAESEEEAHVILSAEDIVK